MAHVHHHRTYFVSKCEHRCAAEARSMNGLHSYLGQDFAGVCKSHECNAIHEERSDKGWLKATEQCRPTAFSVHLREHERWNIQRLSNHDHDCSREQPRIMSMRSVLFFQMCMKTRAFENQAGYFDRNFRTVRAERS